MKKNTDELLKVLKEARSIDAYIDSEADNISPITPVNTYLDKIMEERELSKPEVIHSSYLDRSYAYDIFSGKKHPSRDKLLCLAIAMKLKIDDIQQLLKLTGYPPLYPKIERDGIFIFGIERGLGIMDINELMYDTGNTQIL